MATNSVLTIEKGTLEPGHACCAAIASQQPWMAAARTRVEVLLSAFSAVVMLGVAAGRSLHWRNSRLAKTKGW